MNLKLQMGKFFLKVHWLGFEDTDDTWESFETMCEDVPNLVFESLQNSSNRYKSRALQYFTKLRFTEKVAFLSMSESRRFSRGWLPIEQCCIKFGVGDYSSIRNGIYLWHKSTRQIYSQLQLLLNKQLIIE